MTNSGTILALQLLKKGDRDAFRHLVLSYSSLFFNKASMYCRNRQDAEDALQDSFVIIYEKTPAFVGASTHAYISWCCKIVVNTCLGKYRRNYFTLERNELTENTDIHIDPAIYSKLGNDELMNIINELPIGYREIFSLFAIEGFSHREIAESMGITESTSRSQYIRAKRKIKSLLSSYSSKNMVS